MSLSVTIPVRTVSETNAHEHWRTRQKRAKQHRGITSLLLRSAIGKPPSTPLLVTMTRIAPRRLDSDNLAASCKHVRDGVADFLGVNDGDESKVRWSYAQRRVTTNFYAVEIVIDDARSEAEFCRELDEVLG